MNSTPNTPAELAALQETTPTQSVTEALLALNASEAKEVLMTALATLRDFHAQTAHESVANGDDNWFIWTRDAEKLNTALTLLDSVELD